MDSAESKKSHFKKVVFSAFFIVKRILKNSIGIEHILFHRMWDVMEKKFWVLSIQH